MKSLHPYIIPIVAVFILFLGNREATAQTVEFERIVPASEQTVDCSESSLENLERTPVNTILEEDYPYLQDINCLKNGFFQNFPGLNVNFRSAHPDIRTHYVLKANGSGIHVQAKYDKKGKLVHARLIRENVRMPYDIRRYIHSGEYEEWTMTGNEMIVEDFDPDQTRFNITLSNGNEQQVLQFSQNGNNYEYLVLN